MNTDEPASTERLTHRLRAMMARTVANGCTPEEELAAARQVAKVIEQMDSGETGGRPAPPSWAGNERGSSEYRAILEKNTAETMLKAAVLELALSHIALVSPPGRAIAGALRDRVGIHELLLPHLGMMLAGGASGPGQALLRHTIDELVYDGALPPHLDLPLER